MIDLVTFSKRASAEVSNMNEELQKTILVLQKSEVEEREVLKRAAAEGDLRENAAFTEAVKKLARIGGDIARSYSQIEALRKVREVNYVPVGKVVLYTTVRLIYCIAGSKDYKEIVVKLYPENVSNAGKGILAINTPVGARLIDCKEGDVFNIPHTKRGRLVQYKVEEIY